MTWPRNVTLSAEPASVLAVDLETLKARLGITGSGEDAILTTYIEVASRVLAGPSGIGRDYWRQSIVEDLPGEGGQFLSLSIWPVEQVSAISWDGSAATGFEIINADRRQVYRVDRWNVSPVVDELRNHRAILYEATYVGGWRMPDDEPGAWAATNAYALGDFVRVLTGSSRFYFEATTAGTSDAAEPTWPTTEGDTVADGSVVWTARLSPMLPADLQEAALIQAMDYYRGSLDVPPSHLKKEGGEGWSLEYRDTAGAVGDTEINEATKAICRRYR